MRRTARTRHAAVEPGQPCRSVDDAMNSLLMACANYWMSPFQVGSHHLARAFVRQGWDVGFVSDPISPVHLLGRRSHELTERYRLYRAGGVRSTEEPVWAWVPGAALTPHNKPLLKSRWVWWNWARLAYPSVPSTLRRHGFGAVDCLYVDSPIHLSWLGGIQYGTSVYRVADNPAGFDKYVPVYDEMERELARRVDLVVFSARTLQARVERLRPKRMHYLPNGVDVGHFVGVAAERPAEYQSIHTPIAVYVGAMEQWFDYELMNLLAGRLPEVSFVLIGPDEMARSRITPRSNVHLLGRRSYRALPGYLQHATVGIIPFDVARHGTLVNSIHPLKLYEYMACGLPVVSTDWEELRGLNSPATLCRSAESFVEGVARAVRDGGDRDSRIRYAAAQDWSERARRLMSLLDLDGRGKDEGRGGAGLVAGYERST